MPKPFDLQIDRFIRACPSDVFRAVSDPDLRRRWLYDLPGARTLSFSLDFREGGYERTRFQFDGGAVFEVELLHHKIVPDRSVSASRVLRIGGQDASSAERLLTMRPLNDGCLVRFAETVRFHGTLDSLPRHRDMVTYVMDRLGAVVAWSRNRVA